MTRRLQALACAALFAVFAGTPAAAARQNQNSNSHSFDQHSIGSPVYSSHYQKRLYPGPGRYHKRKVVKVKTAKHRRAVHHRVAQHRPRVAAYRGSATILPHPPGCPSRAFCGCGVSQRLLGKTVRAGGLAIAANWMGFPRTACAPGMAAARRGHVFAIEQCLPGNMALAYDPNSGGRLTRRHVRSLAGYAIVNPHGAYTQVNGKPGRSYRSHRAARYAKRYKRRYAHAG